MLEKEQAHFLSNSIEEAQSSFYEIKKLDTTAKNLLPGFQKGKTALSGFEITKLDSKTAFLFVFIQSEQNYHLMIFTQNKKKVMAELKQIEMADGNPVLIWKYNPLKRDGKNQERKTYYLQNFESTTMEIPFPKSSADIDLFFNQFFTLCHNRQAADSLGEI